MAKLKTYEARINITYNTVVTVEARNEDEARIKIGNADFTQDHSTAEMVDWEDVREIKETT